jgi:glycosyltransferase involved in cell wall biosynthesis
VKVLLVSNGYPPRGLWGTEFYSRELVRGLVRGGVEVAVLHPQRDGSRARYELEETRVEGVPVFLLHNPGDRRKHFADSYENAHVERVFDELLARFAPDLVHFTYLLWGLSVGLPARCAARGIASVLTLTDYGLVCHRGQMYDDRLQRCFGPHPPQVCARCIREPAPFDAPPLELLAKRAAVRTAAALGGLGAVVTATDVERRERAVRSAFAATDVLIAPTRVLADVFERAGVPRAKIEHVVYALDAEALAAARAEPPRSPVRFGYLGQFTPHKGLGTLCRAVELMRHRLPESVEPWEVCLYGAPSAGRHRLYAERVLARAQGTRLRVLAAFHSGEAARVLAGLHAIVLPSEWDENAPLSILQARAAGVPVIASAVPGVREIVEQGVHGLLFPPGDALALAAAMRSVILGEVRRHPEPSLPMDLGTHVARVLALYARARESAAARAGRTSEVRA